MFLQNRKTGFFFRINTFITCLLAGAVWLLLSYGAIAQSGCSTHYAPGNGWIVEICTTDPSITTPMNVVLDGTAKGQAALIRISHKSQNDSGTPHVAIIYASGFIRLKQNADPAPPIPFGSSFVLGPAYWPNLSTYYHNPQLTRLEIDTRWLPTGPLRMQIEGNNHDFAVSYELTLPPARDRQTRLHVTQIYTTTSAVTIDTTRRKEAQGFKLAQISSMFINGARNGSQTDFHDSSAARFIGNDLVRHQVPFSTITPSDFIFTSPVPMGSTWLDALHTDDQSWKGNTPNVRIALDTLPTGHTITPQGWISATTNPNDDNVGLWLHDDGPASQSWNAGQSESIGYWLLAQDDPPEPWVDLGLRQGQIFLDVESSHGCFLVTDAGQSTSGAVREIAGYTDTALELVYDLGSGDGNWVQLRCNFNPPLEISAFDHLRFDWSGDPDAANSLEVALINPGTGQDNVFGRGYHHSTHRAWWGQLVVPFDFLQPWTNGTTFDPSQVSGFFISVVKDPADDVGGPGRIAIDNLNAYNVSARAVPTKYETVSGNIVAASAIAGWLVGQQQATGLLKSWVEESLCNAHTYDQALALIVFANQGMWTEADALVAALVSTQNADGSWFKSRNCENLAIINNDKWEGDIAWAIYALSRYIELGGGTHPQAITVRNRAADWLVTRLKPTDGCLIIDHTEGTIDAWWALQSSGAAYAAYAEGLKNCLLTQYWDDSMGRFKGGQDWWQPYLDNQTWGTAFLRAIGEEEKALRALSYSRETLLLPAQGGQLYGFDGQGGPWSVWNEGTAQYAAIGGQGANDLLQELLAQQQTSGALPGGPDNFYAGGVWTTRWTGVSSAAWLFNALCQEPFHPPANRGCQQQVYLPIILK